MLFYLSACNCGSCFGMAAGTKSQLVLFGVTFAVALWVVWAFFEYMPEQVVPGSEDRIQMYKRRANADEGTEGEPFAPVMLVFQHCESCFDFEYCIILFNIGHQTIFSDIFFFEPTTSYTIWKIWVGIQCRLCSRKWYDHMKQIVSWLAQFGLA